MKRIALAMVLAAASLALMQAQARSAAPKPAQVPSSWEIDFEHQTPQAIRVQVPGEKSPRTFWYMQYQVTNHTGADQTFVPEFVMYTQTGQMLRAGAGVPFVVYDKVKQTLNNPLIQDSNAIVGKLLQGNDNAKLGVAIWPDFDPQTGIIDIFVGGLSGETAEVTLPQPIEVVQTDISGQKKTVEKTTIILNKTLDLRYLVPGEAANRPNVTPTLEKTSWVMR